MLEPETKEFIPCLTPDSMYKEHMPDNLLGIVMEDIEQGSQEN